jgi:hypothetical protein
VSNADQLRDANPWHPITDAVDLKHLGKLAEEAAELGHAVAWHISGSLEVTWMQIEEEIADVRANSELVIERFRLDGLHITRRAAARAGAVAAPSPMLRRIGGDACRLGCAVARCIIQGVDEVEPVTGKPNRDWLEEAIGDLWGESDLIIEHSRLDAHRIGARIERKKQHLKQWHALA